MEKEDRKQTHKKHNSKRKVLQVSLYEKDRQLMQKRYKKLLTGTEAKEILLYGTHTVQEKKDYAPLNLLTLEIKKISTNIAQIAKSLSHTGNFDQEEDLLSYRKELLALLERSEMFRR